ncbi:MAG: hypothetical protein Q6373_011585 [Candidatus Sigynarchaeota archaeon]
MPRRLTRPEVVRRIAIRAILDARGDLTYADLASLFVASRRTIHDAKRHPVADWLRILAAAPLPSGRGIGVAGGTAPRPGQAQVARPRASRSNAKLVPPRSPLPLHELYHARRRLVEHAVAANPEEKAFKDNLKG